MMNEVIRLIRTMVQAAVAAVVVWLADKGIQVDSDALLLVVWPFVMAATTAGVKFLSELPGVGPWIALLNGPRVEPQYDYDDVAA